MNLSMSFTTYDILPVNGSVNSIASVEETGGATSAISVAIMVCIVKSLTFKVIESPSKYLPRLEESDYEKCIEDIYSYFLPIVGPQAVILMTLIITFILMLPWKNKVVMYLINLPGHILLIRFHTFKLDWKIECIKIFFLCKDDGKFPLTIEHGDKLCALYFMTVVLNILVVLLYAYKLISGISNMYCSKNESQTDDTIPIESK